MYLYVWSYDWSHGDWSHKCFGAWFVPASPLCIRSLCDFLLIVCFCFFFGLCLLVFSFALYFWWMGSHPWFLFTGFFFFTLIISDIEYDSTLDFCWLHQSSLTWDSSFRDQKGKGAQVLGILLPKPLKYNIWDENGMPIYIQDFLTYR